MSTKKQKRVAVLTFTDYIQYKITDIHITKSLKAINKHNLGVVNPNIFDAASGHFIEDPKFKNHPNRKFNTQAHFTLHRTVDYKIKVTLYNDGTRDIEICS